MWHGSYALFHRHYYRMPVCISSKASKFLTTIRYSLPYLFLFFIRTAERRSNQLLKTTIQFEDEEICRTEYSTANKLERGYDPQTMVCAGDLVTGNDTCPVRTTQGYTRLTYPVRLT